MEEPVRTPAVVALLLMTLAVLPVAAETWLLGGALVAEVVDDDETGLVNLVDVQGSVWDVDLPYETDLLVYLRWEAEGEHDLDIYVLDPAGDEVTHLQDSLDFEDYGTNFTTHSLENSVFEEEGTYVVAVYVDGEELLDLPYCVNDDSGAPDEPYLLMSLPAIDGWAEDTDNGYWGYVEGAFEHYTFAKFPDSDDFAIVTLWFSGDDSYEQRIEIADPGGKVVGRSEAQEIDAWPGELTVITDYFEDFTFDAPGDYLVTVYLDGEEWYTYMLRAVRGE
jgi:hypothetical protein